MSEETYVLEFIKNFCTHVRLLTGNGGQLFGFSIKLDEEFDLDKIYQILKKDFSPNIDLSDDNNKYKVAFLMSYEQNNNEDVYSISAMEKYLKGKKQTNTLFFYKLVWAGRPKPLAYLQ